MVQASLIVLVSFAVTALVMVAVFPAHARGGVTDQAAVPDIRPAVLVEYRGATPIDGSSASTCPALTQPGSSASCPYIDGLVRRDGGAPRGARGADDEVPLVCPYLSTRSAGTGCPALSGRTTSTECPYLSQKDRPDASPRIADRYRSMDL
jgi:hypothetical protein